MSDMSKFEHKLKWSALAFNCWADAKDYIAIKREVTEMNNFVAKDMGAMAKKVDDLIKELGKISER